jgi:chromosome segregation ATPase
MNTFVSNTRPGLLRACFAVCVSLLLALSHTTPAHAIKKCQDADGNWHYGDTAVDECERSKVTTLNSRGFIASEDEAPKTQEEIAAEEASLAKERAEEKRLEEEKAERERLLSVYQTEADIDRQLDNQMYSVDSSIAVHKVYLKGMKDKVARLVEKKSTQKGAAAKRTQGEIDKAEAKINESEEELKHLDEQKEAIQARFAREKELFRSIKAGT